MKDQTKKRTGGHVIVLGPLAATLLSDLQGAVPARGAGGRTRRERHSESSNAGRQDGIEGRMDREIGIDR